MFVVYVLKKLDDLHVSLPPTRCLDYWLGSPPIFKLDDRTQRNPPSWTAGAGPENIKSAQAAIPQEAQNLGRFASPSLGQLRHMCHGRFYWGVGSGGFPGDFEIFGFDPKSGEQRSMTRDAVELVLQLWQDPRPGLYEHKYWRFTIPQSDDEIGLRFHLKPYQNPHPPIGVAGVSAKSDTLRLAGERGWIPMSINIVPSKFLQSHWESVEAGAQHVGKTADRSKWRIARDIFIADTTQEARKLALKGTLGRDYRDYFLRLLPKCHMMHLMKNDPDMPDSDITPEYLIDNVWIVGSPDDVAEKLQQLDQDVGGFGVLMAMGHEWDPKEHWLHSMRLLKEEVLPRLG